MITILLLTNTPTPNSEGQIESRVGPDRALLISGLIRQGFRVKGRALNRFPINPLANLGTFFAGFDPIRSISVLIFDRDVDVIISVGESNIAIPLFLRKILFFKPKFVLREISQRGWRKRDIIVDYVLRRIDRVMVLTTHQKVWAERALSLRAPLDLVGFAIDENFFRPQGSIDGQYILSVGDDYGRDYQCLISACRYTEHRLILRTSLSLDIPEDMRHRVTVLGRLSYLQLRDLYASASIVVVPLQNVDHPSGITSLFEAMAMGCCVVASDIGSTRDIVRDQVNGMVVPSGASDVMRDLLNKLSNDENLRRRLGKNARNTIETEQSYSLYVERFAESVRSAFQ